MVPHVTTAEEARHIVEMTRFHPLGRRAMDGGNPDGLYCQIPLADYLAHANSQRVLIFQIESPEALANVEKIAAVPGFNFLLFGRATSAICWVNRGSSMTRKFWPRANASPTAARANGKHCMCPGMLAPRSVLEEEGYDAFNLGADVIGLGQYTKDRLAAFHHEAPKQGAHGVYQPAKP